MSRDEAFAPPDDQTLYLGLGETSVFSYADMIEEIGPDQAPQDAYDLEALLWSFDAIRLSE